ncbi:hypothetical protein HK097_004869 [Rhizophlyctis rosea]|uniref:Uncharacterized protein n=1 Tax=Rhizophlyctis rosea TaxID=64517 RepID=A0AAD5SKI0_9FUNG|nr:hypothetical protein HK097_004869 [Rhizophlyctis rosea]
MRQKSQKPTTTTTKPKTHPWDSYTTAVPKVSPVRKRTRCLFTCVPTVTRPILDKFFARYPDIILRDCITFIGGTILVMEGDPAFIEAYFRTRTTLSFIPFDHENKIKEFDEETGSLSVDQIYAMEEVEKSYESLIKNGYEADGDDNISETSSLTDGVLASQVAGQVVGAAQEAGEAAAPVPKDLAASAQQTVGQAAQQQTVSSATAPSTVPTTVTAVEAPSAVRVAGTPVYVVPHASLCESKRADSLAGTGNLSGGSSNVPKQTLKTMSDAAFRLPTHKQTLKTMSDGTFPQKDADDDVAKSAEAVTDGEKIVETPPTAESKEKKTTTKKAFTTTAKKTTQTDRTLIVSGPRASKLKKIDYKRLATVGTTANAPAKTAAAKKAAPLAGVDVFKAAVLAARTGLEFGCYCGARRAPTDFLCEECRRWGYKGWSYVCKVCAAETETEEEEIAEEGERPDGSRAAAAGQ